jgi:glycosyltransferase involved in cell wall biosynthesis
MLRGYATSMRIEVIPHPATANTMNPAIAREALRLPDGPPIAVLPGVLKRSKLVQEALDAFAPLIARERWRPLLAGGLRDASIKTTAARIGAEVMEAPNDLDYDAAIAAADVVLILRGESVGETNGPLLDAIGAGKAILATATGSIPEVAGDAAIYCDPSLRDLPEQLHTFEDPAVRAELQGHSAERRDRLTWRESAEQHAPLLVTLAR